jgi:cytochrome c oxidase subunit 2
MVAIGVIASVIGVALGLAIDWFPDQGSTQAEKVDTLYDVLIIVSVPIFVLVQVVVLFAVWKFRMKPGEELKDGAPIHGNTRLEIIWTAIPAIILVALCSYAYVVLRDIEEKPPGREIKVGVLGQQFAWSYEYPAALTGGKKVVSDQLYLPVRQSVEFQVRARDVIHDFWVPDFRMKIDAVPGITTEYRITPRRTGTFPVVCAELCGLGHATMRSTVRVVTEAAFREWLRKQAAPAVAEGASPEERAAAGKRVFLGAAACGTCHELADANSTGKIGPSLDEALEGKDKDFIRDAIVNPDARVAPGFPKGVMPPNFGDTLSPDELQALVDYLAEVTSG